MVSGSCWETLMSQRPDERFNSIFFTRTARDFNHFILETGLTYLKIGDHHFTCFRNENLKLNKLDRFHVCPCLLDIIPSVSVTTLPRELSDHCPVLLSSSEWYFGPSPFRLFNSWMIRDGFKKAFIIAWNNFCRLWYPWLLLGSHAWNSFAGYGTPIEEMESKNLIDLMVHLDSKGEIKLLNQDKIETRRNGYQRIVELEKWVVLDVKQKARIKWVIDRDENSRYFYGFVNNNGKNRTNGLMVNGEWCTNPSRIKKEVLRFLKIKSKSSGHQGQNYVTHILKKSTKMLLTH